VGAQTEYSRSVARWAVLTTERPRVGSVPIGHGAAKPIKAPHVKLADTDPPKGTVVDFGPSEYSSVASHRAWIRKVTGV
jgi:hypothetical protein